MAGAGIGAEFLPRAGKLSVVDHTIAELTSAISSGRFKPGCKIPNEFELVAELGVSRNSLREAIKMLECMGVVEIRRGDGTYVCSQLNPSVLDNVVYSLIFDLSTSQELLELRQILDEMIVRLAIEKIEPEDIFFLEDNIAQMTSYIAQGDSENASLADYEFHIRLIDIGKNPFFMRISKGIYRLFSQSIAKTILLDQDASSAPVYHQNILNCIIEKRYDDVSSVISDSLKTWRDILKRD